MKYYLINDYEVINEHTKICYYELLYEDEYKLYMYAKLHLRHLEIWGPYSDFDVLQFKPKEISDIEYSVLDKHKPLGCYHIFTYLVQYLVSKAEDVDIELPEYMSQINNELLISVIDALNNK